MRGLASVLILSLVAMSSGADQPVSMKLKPPELREVTEWINSKPLTFKELEGKVVVIHYWAFG